MTCEAVPVDPKRAHEIWPTVAPLIREAMARAAMSEFATVEHNIRNGDALLWLAWDGEQIRAAAVTELHRINGRKFCLIVACGGRERERWLSLISDLEQFARDEGCDAMRICGRRGWTRVLPDYRATRVILEKEL